MTNLTPLTSKKRAAAAEVKRKPARRCVASKRSETPVARCLVYAIEGNRALGTRLHRTIRLRQAANPGPLSQMLRQSMAWSTMQQRDAENSAPRAAMIKPKGARVGRCHRILSPGARAYRRLSGGSNSSRPALIKTFANSEEECLSCSENWWLH